MIRHFLKLAWNRKRANALILVEIFFSFLVVFAVALQSVYLWTNLRRPLGFEVEDVWTVSMEMDRPADEAAARRQVETLARLLREVERLDRVERVAGAMAVPYSEESRTEGLSEEPETGATPPPVSVEIDEVTDGFADVVGLDLVSGRWFEPADAALAWMPVVLDLEATRALFGDDDPVGRWLAQGPDRPRRRVVGVVSDFRQHGELSGPQPYMFERVSVTEPSHRTPRNLVLKMAPGTTADYEETVLGRLRGVAPEWTFGVKALDVVRSTNLRLRVIPLGAVALIAAFLLAMVALGLTGVLWQNVVQRTREIGLRRANGATRTAIHRQVVGELLVMTTSAVILGTLLVVQLPILEVLGSLSPGVFSAGLVVALALIYGLTAICALYPSWMAGRVQPAEALRWE